MRIWSIHPKYLDSKGLVAVWRESLLAQNVLLGKTKGYKNHPQLIRFRSHNQPIAAIGRYLFLIYLEAQNRQYNFNKNKIIAPSIKLDTLSVTSEQLKHEFEHLKSKLEIRNKMQYHKISNIIMPETHPLFCMIEGNIAPWEKR